MTDLPGVPSAWAPYIPILTSLARNLVAAAGAANITWAQSVTADQLQTWIGVLMVVAAAAHGVYQKFATVKVIAKAAAADPSAAPPSVPA